MSIIDLHQQCASSVSTDKLAILCATIESLPRELIDKVEFVKVTWEEDKSGGVVLPCVEIKFK